MKRILIAEDDQKIAAALEIRLTAAGYDVQILPDAFPTYLQAATDPPDLIISDIWMPVGLGFSMAEGLQELPPGLPVIS